MKNTILLIGPCHNKKNPKETGGAVILFENLLQEAKKQNTIVYIVVDTNKKNYSNILIAYISIVYEIFRKQHKVSHISLHSSRDYLYLAPLVIFIGKIFGKTTSLRKFGGEAWDTYKNAGRFKKIVLKFIYHNIDYIFMEMKSLVEHFRILNTKTYWFPNVRNKPNFEVQKERRFSRKYVFIGHVVSEKGIDKIAQVAKLLDNTFSIDIYGPVIERKYNSFFFKKHNIHYKGSLHQEEVLETLSKYDVLLLPSYKEGYPGVVLEAYSVGLPIIASDLPGLREITDNYETGILIPVGDINELKKAMEYFDETNHVKMSKKALKKFDLFDSEKRTSMFFDIVLAKK